MYKILQILISTLFRFHCMLAGHLYVVRLAVYCARNNCVKDPIHSKSLCSLEEMRLQQWFVAVALHPGILRKPRGVGGQKLLRDVTKATTSSRPGHSPFQMLEPSPAHSETLWGHSIPGWWRQLLLSCFQVQAVASWVRIPGMYTNTPIHTEDTRMAS